MLRVLVFANGDLNDGPAVQTALTAAGEAHVIAADGGAHLAQRCGLQPNLIVGDMDSIDGGALAAWQDQGVRVEQASPDKDETDLELALLAAAQLGADWVRVLGAVGSRLDQTLANVYLLALPALAGRDVRLVSGSQTMWLVGPGQHALDGAVGDTISLLPMGGDACGVRTRGMRYPLRDETLHFGPARGISNVIASSDAGFALAAGLLLVVHTPGRA